MATPGAVAVLTCPAACLVAEACRRIVRDVAQSSDLSRITVLLPDLHAAPPFARALHAHLGAAALLPRLTTLRQWASELPLCRPLADSAAIQPLAASAAIQPLADSAREAAIYHALAERRWFQDQDLWSVAAELAALFDELTRWHVGLPASADDFARRLERAYQARAGAWFAFEARLVHELWHALDADASNAEAAYQLRLGLLAGKVTDPVYAVGLAQLAPAETGFLQRCAERVPLVRIVEETAELSLAAFERTLRTAWPEVVTTALADRARTLRQASPESGLGGRVHFRGADEAEQEAQIIASSVRGWLRAGRKSIAVVALDRMVARRARALLERALVLVRDEAGWPLSTTSAATAVGRWLDLASNDCHHRDLLDLLKSPFAFADWPRAQRQRTVWRFEQALRRAGIRAGLERFIELAQQLDDRAASSMLLRVQRSAQALVRMRRKSLSGWLAALRSSLSEIGVQRGLAADAAGVQVLELIDTLAAELAGDRIAVTFPEFRRWWARRLEAAAFRDSSIDSPVVFTSLDATCLRSFDATLIMGADANRLPGSGAAGMFFNQRVRRDLGLPGAEAHAHEVQELLIGLLARSGETLVTWQRSVAGEPNLISPLFERLRALHELAWAQPLDDADPAQPLELQPRHDEHDAPFDPTMPPAPRVPASLVPQAISASSYNTLLACPYRFYARHALGLRESDEVQEELEKRDYGTLVHEIMTRFHNARPRVLELEPEVAERELRACSEAVFAGEIAQNYIARAWLARWRALIPRYLAWQREREAQGWRFHAGEADRSVSIHTPAGRTFTLRGRIDRVDVRADGAAAVVDYKTRARARLAAELESAGEDVQLPVYALLWDQPVAEALYLAMDLEEVEPVALEHDVAVHAAEVRARLSELVDRISDGAPLPAQGVEATCAYCEMHGLCRRRHWS
jgi:ATP-dependent helicase/nuclease subunit B